MKIYTPAATRQLLKPTPDKCGYTLKLGNRILGFVPAGPGKSPVPLEYVLKTITDLNQNFPLGWLGDFPIFLTDLDHFFYDPQSGTWEPYHIYGKTYPGGIIIPAQADPDEPRAAMTIVHELGHVVMLKLTDSPDFLGKETPKLAEYRTLRKLGPEINYGWTWEDQLYEVFAEDFRYLFGPPMARLERFRTIDEPVDPRPPGPEIKRWFLSLLPKAIPDLRIWVIGEEDKIMDKPKFTDIDGHWAKADIEAVAEAGLMTGYPDGRFGPDEPVTRAQLAAVINRLRRS